MATTTPCRLLSLPPELRNEIYELAFTTSVGEKVNLFAHKPPTKSLLLTCREVYNEAGGLYKEAYRTFWRSSNFIVEGETTTSLEVGPTAYQELREEDVEHITSLTVYAPEQFGDHLLRYREDIWTDCEESSGVGEILLLIVPKSERSPRMVRLPAVQGWVTETTHDGFVYQLLTVDKDADEEAVARIRGGAGRNCLSRRELEAAIIHCAGRCFL